MKHFKMSLRFMVLLPLLSAAGGVQAQIYMCKDANGRTITSDRPLPECADRPMRELDRHGVVRREIEAPLTPEQRRQRQLEQEARKAAEEAAAEQKRNDRLLRQRYRNEHDIEIARTRALEIVQDQIKHEKTALVSAQKRQQQAQTEVEGYKKKNTAVPLVVQHKLNDAAQSINSAEKAIQDRDAEIVRINAQFDATLQRYRELTGAAAAK